MINNLVDVGVCRVPESLEKDTTKMLELGATERYQVFMVDLGILILVLVK